MSLEQNKAVLRRIYDEVWNKRNYSVIPELVSPDFTYRSPRGVFTGPQGYQEVVTSSISAFPDFHYSLDEVIGEGDRLVGRLTMTGTMKGRWRNFEPTGERITWAGLSSTASRAARWLNR